MCCAPRDGYVSRAIVMSKERQGWTLRASGPPPQVMSRSIRILPVGLRVDPVAQHRPSRRDSDVGSLLPISIAHGYLVDGPVALFAADASGDEATFRCEGLMLSPLGTTAASMMGEWFARLSAGGRVVHDLQTRPWVRRTVRSSTLTAFTG